MQVPSSFLIVRIVGHSLTPCTPAQISFSTFTWATEQVNLQMALRQCEHECVSRGASSDRNSCYNQACCIDTFSLASERLWVPGAASKSTNTIPQYQSMQTHLGCFLSLGRCRLLSLDSFHQCIDVCCEVDVGCFGRLGA